MIKSFRARLTLWNVVVIAIVLVGFSVSIIYANQIRLANDIDRELVDRALHSPPGPPALNGQGGAGGGFGGQGGAGGGFGGQGGQVGRGGQGGPGEADIPGDNAPDGEGQGQLSPRFNDPAAIRFADVHRPRRFNPQGQPMGPMQDEPFDPKALVEALQGHAVYSNGEFDGEPIRIFTLPLKQGPNAGGAVQVARETRDLDHIWASQIGTLLWFLPFAILGAATGAFFLTKRATKPIADMKEAANTISEQDLSRRLPIQGEDEFAELGMTFNAMVGRLEESFGRLRTAYSSLEEAHETQKRFTADASHELRTPLTRLRLATSSALGANATDDERREALKIADAAAKSMGRLVQEMLVLARADAGQLTMQKERLDLRVVATDVLAEFAPGKVDFQAEMQESPVMILGDPDHLQRVIRNLLENALRYTPAGGAIKLSVCSDHTGAYLKVADTGKGIAPEHLPHITERFYRADPSRSRDDGGCGLGLAICETVIQAHGGVMSIQSELGRGTTVTIRLEKI